MAHNIKCVLYNISQSSRWMIVENPQNGSLKGICLAAAVLITVYLSRNWMQDSNSILDPVPMILCNLLVIYCFFGVWRQGHWQQQARCLARRPRFSGQDWPWARHPVALASPTRQWTPVALRLGRTGQARARLARRNPPPAPWPQRSEPEPRPGRRPSGS